MTKASSEVLVQAANRIRGEIENAVPGPDNNGPLWHSIRQDNWRGAVFELDHAPVLPLMVEPFTSFQPGNPLRVEAKQYFDPYATDSVLWVRPSGEALKIDSSGYSMNTLSLHAWQRRLPRGTPEQDFFIQHRLPVGISEADYVESATLLLGQHVSDFTRNIGELGLYAAFTGAILDLRNNGASGVLEQSSRTYGWKSFRNQTSENGFSLEASELHAVDKNRELFAVTIALARMFTTDTATGSAEGVLTNHLHIAHDASGNVITASRRAQIGFFTPPEELDDINKRKAVFISPNTKTSFNSFFYPDPDPTHKTLDWFIHLITEPISSEDANPEL